MTAADFLPKRLSIPALRRASKQCRGCELYKNATQTVFGEGPADAKLFFVGEQPGDQEDRAGHPFVGGAGRIFDAALADAGIDRSQVYVTNAVKHFKWEPRGKRRIHKKPSAREIAACRPWLEAEIRTIHPRIIVCLGATAAQSLLGSSFRVTKQRGELIKSDWAPWIMATYHPSAVLRAPDEAERARLNAEFTSDLHRAVKQLQKQ
jgi:DNA polymerase